MCSASPARMDKAVSGAMAVEMEMSGPLTSVFLESFCNTGSRCHF